MLFALQDLNENSEKTTDEEDFFQETDWFDFTDGYNGRLFKKVSDP